MSQTNHASLNLEGSRALVVGGASGIGEGIARALQDIGAHVVVADVNFGAASSLADKLSRSGNPVAAFEVDVSSEESVASLVESVHEELGGIDVLLHVAGVGAPTPVVNMSLEHWNRTIGINLTGPFLVTRAVLPGMIDQGAGRIVIVSSQLAFLGEPGLAHYCASKSGIHGFIKSLAREVAVHGITVNALAPGPTDTPLFRLLPEEIRESIRASVPLGRIGKVSEIVPTALLLASAGGSFYTGAILSPNGGHAMP